jgi:hypothetical protein
MIPFIGSLVYALFLWIPEGLSSVLPINVYLTVTKNPYLFIIAFTAICLGVLIEVFASSSDSRLSRLSANSRQIQIIAVLCFVSAVISVWSTTGYSLSSSRILPILLEGKYAIIYPLVLYIFALLLNPSVKFDLSFDNFIKNISIILLIASPLVLFGLWQINRAWLEIIIITLITLLAGLGLLIYNEIIRKN